VKILAEFDRGEDGISTHPEIRHYDIRQLTDYNGNLHCPVCGGMPFTVQFNLDGALVYSCWKCPVHLRIEHE
jgi:hypothetical protein